MKEDSIVKLQAHVRGHLQRKQTKQMKKQSQFSVSTAAQEEYFKKEELMETLSKNPYNPAKTKEFREAF